MPFDYIGWSRAKLYHHAVQIDDKKYFHVFIVDGAYHEVVTEGERKEAMNKALQSCMAWLERFSDTNKTFVVFSNACEIGTIVTGRIALVDAKRIELIDEKVRLASESDEEEAERMARLG